MGRGLAGCREPCGAALITVTVKVSYLSVDQVRMDYEFVLPQAYIHACSYLYSCSCSCSYSCASACDVVSAVYNRVLVHVMYGQLRDGWFLAARRSQ